VLSKRWQLTTFISDKGGKMRLFFALWIFCVSFLLFTSLYAQNHMDFMTTLTGEFIGSYFGRSVVSLDYNGDGYDDLVVASSLWNPTGVYNENIRYGKIYFYWGGPGFDNNPDFVIEGTYTPQFGSVSALIDAEDLNNDGFDDLIITVYTPDITQFIGVYLGRANPLSVPDIVWSAPGGVEFNVHALGDINSDLNDDLSIDYENTSIHTQFVRVWDNINGEPYQFRSTYNSFSPCLIGVGDINGDGYDDCHLSLPIDHQNNYTNKIVYLGNQNFPVTDSVSLYENVYNTNSRACALGDINGDGYDDFSSYGMNVHLGSPNLSVLPSFILSVPSVTWGYNNNQGLRMVHGDFNGDGYDDLVASDHRWSLFDGDVLIWLGRQNVNGIYDLRLTAPEISSNFGYSKAAGDFNGDGLCDLAISAPYYYEGGPQFEQGKVFIYSGNTTLADTTVGNDDEIAPMITNSISIYPNPVSRNQPFTNLKLSGHGISRNEKITVEMFNLKGQMVRTWEKAADDPGSGVYHIDCDGIASGIYFMHAKHGNEGLGSTKLLIY
jgi:hypothetical protein